MRIDLDMPVSCVDGPYGEVADVVIAPGSQRVTHLVVVPHDRSQLARLIAIATARGADAPAAGLTLTATIATLTESESIAGSAYLGPGEFVEPGADWDVGIQEAYPIPDGGSLGPEILGAGVPMQYEQHVGVNYHRIPKGDVEISRASPVTSADGHHLGHVIGLTLDDEHHITALLLEHGHLWGKRTVPIPGPTIDRIDTDELVLTLTADQVGALQPLPTHHHWGL